jgi:2-polyprenyl-3-methyl-5-hydroxy-6-metoxy-1,4-benzoquinol methylase
MTETRAQLTETCWACGGDAPLTHDFAPARYHRCPACGMLFQSERGLDELRRLYDDDYFAEHAGGGHYADEDAQRHHEARVRLRRLRPYARSGRLLEVGSAGGHFLARAVGEGFSVQGVEPVGSFAEEARTRFGVPVETGYVEEVELGAEPFDVACAFHVLEHIAQPRPVLEQLRARMRPGAALFVEVPNIASYAARTRGAAWGALEPLHHVGHFTPRSLRTMLEAAGFTVDATETVPFFTYLRPRGKLSPVQLAHRAALSARAAVAPFGAHPDRHELLRAFARA